MRKIDWPKEDTDVSKFKARVEYANDVYDDLVYHP